MPDGSRNVLGQPLEACCLRPVAGFYRNGYCETGPEDAGRHVVCAEMTRNFLDYTASRGNDLASPGPGFPGLKPGDRWCLCAARWEEARAAGAAPPVVLAGTHEAALEIVDLDALKAVALDLQ
ncbi:DUF2237 domain-containing protein [Spectribacter hydrogenoxidans]|uniref:DUF2237 domain-containing protein n=1 Tax=Spectribacter hydrogenoxidans TaxID=3075608 RepID=A0ABU3C345_9GAMM|nr:DUF2237 domain-containing protein [Salinisphaera sp. W335]MDT0635811.1 DUF2237 domain-containing protein [Salinisphaera sp. W335]